VPGTTPDFRSRYNGEDRELQYTYARTSNKRWSHDECAAVLEIGVRDRLTLGFRFIGADDDPNYEIRQAASREKHAARSRKYRAKHSTGANPGRPKSEGAKPWEAEGISKATYYRRKAATPTDPVRLKPRARHTLKTLNTVDSNIIGGVTEFQSHAGRPPDHPSPARQAPGRQMPVPVRVVLEGEIVVDSGVAFAMGPAPNIYFY
jgi:hypothetical protein